MNELFLERIKSYLSNEDYKKFIDTIDIEPKNGFTLNYNKLNESTLDFEELKNKWNLLESYKNDKYSYYTYDKKYLEQLNIFPGKHPLYHAGLYYIQEPSSNMVLRDINIKEHYKILDLCASPGGKTIQSLYQIDIKKGGMVYSNDINKDRAKIIYSNAERMGFLDSIKILNKNPLFFLDDYQNYFDLVILDAPCSGEGMIRKNKTAKEQWSISLINNCQKIQRNLIDIATRLIKEGGFLSYSTCTYAKEEDEDNVDYILNKYNDFQLIEKRKIYHFEGIGEGQFYARFKRN